MSLVTGSSTQCEIEWNVEDLKQELKNSADAFVKAVQPHAANLGKAIAGGSIVSLVNTGGAAIKANLAGSVPLAAPVAAAAIDTCTVPVTAFISQRSSEIIDSSMPKAASVAKESMHKSIDSGVDLTSRSFSFFK